MPPITHPNSTKSYTHPNIVSHQTMQPQRDEGQESTHGTPPATTKYPDAGVFDSNILPGGASVNNIVDAGKAVVGVGHELFSDEAAHAADDKRRIADPEGYYTKTKPSHPGLGPKNPFGLVHDVLTGKER